MAAVKRPKRLFTKNTGLCEVERRRIGADACPVPEGHEEGLASAKLQIQAPVNGGRNYNGRTGFATQEGCYKIRLYAGTPEHPALLMVTSDAASRVTT